MIKRIIALSFFAIATVAQNNVYTSNVQTVKGWKRTHVMGVPGGTLLDASGKIASEAQMQAVEHMLTNASDITEGAWQGFSNAVERLEQAAVRTNDFTGRLYIAADLDPDPLYQNVEAYELTEEMSTTGKVSYLHFTKALEEPPKTTWHFDMGAAGEAWVPGEVLEETTYAGFDIWKIFIPKPAIAANAVLRTNRFMKFGAPDTGLDVPATGIRIIEGGVTNEPITGLVIVTNGLHEYKFTFQSGFFYGITTNILEVTP